MIYSLLWDEIQHLSDDDDDDGCKDNNDDSGKDDDVIMIIIVRDGNNHDKIQSNSHTDALSVAVQHILKNRFKPSQDVVSAVM